MMKKLIAVLVAGTALTSAAYASDGTVNITGKVTGSTCAVSNLTGGILTVALPTVSTTTLSTAGSTAGTTPFKLTLTGCNLSSPDTKVLANFEAGPNLDFGNGNLKNTGGSNVEVQLLNSAFQAINIAAGNANNNSLANAVAPTSGAATLNYAAQYYATAPATAGSVSTSVTFSLAYF